MRRWFLPLLLAAMLPSKALAQDGSPETPRGCDGANDCSDEQRCEAGTCVTAVVGPRARPGISIGFPAGVIAGMSTFIPAYLSSLGVVIATSAADGGPSIGGGAVPIVGALTFAAKSGVEPARATALLIGGALQGAGLVTMLASIIITPPPSDGVATVRITPTASPYATGLTATVTF